MGYFSKGCSMDVLHNVIKRLQILCGQPGWTKLSGGGEMYSPEGDKSGVLKGEQAAEDYAHLLKYISDHLAPALLKLGWVKEKDGYRYKVANGTYLLYLKHTDPQSWHLDSGDGSTVSVL